MGETTFKVKESMQELLRHCHSLFNRLPYIHQSCCKNDCSWHWTEKFYYKNDTYDCLKGLCFYSLNYGPSFASEIYHYLEASRILESIINENVNRVKILSLGCGFSPDYYAVMKYINENHLGVTCQYHGIDNQPLWDEVRCPNDNSSYENKDLTEGFDLSGYNIIFLGKVYSTLLKNRQHIPFMNQFVPQVRDKIDRGNYVVYIDVNHCKLGRDDFRNRIEGIFPNYNGYYSRSSKSKYTETDWIEIHEDKIEFHMPADISVTPLGKTCDTIFFQYRK